MVKGFKSAILVTLIAAVSALPVMAQNWPEVFRVEGVAAADVLNIRAEPKAGAKIVGTYGAHDFNIEVLGLSEDGRWGRVGVPEGNGWVAMRFLVATPVAESDLPRPLRCHGTEPFWSISLDPRGGAEWDSPETGPRPLSAQEELVVPGYAGGYWLRLLDRPEKRHDLAITREYCDDGMSDRAYGLAAVMFTRSQDGNRVYRGCCTLDSR